MVVGVDVAVVSAAACVPLWLDGRPDVVDDAIADGGGVDSVSIGKVC